MHSRFLLVLWFVTGAVEAHAQAPGRVGLSWNAPSPRLTTEHSLLGATPTTGFSWNPPPTSSLAPATTSLLWSVIGTAGGVLFGYALGEEINRENGETDPYNQNQARAASVSLVTPVASGIGAAYGVREGGGRGAGTATYIVSALAGYVPTFLILLSVNQDAPDYNVPRQIVLPVALASAAVAWLTAVITDRLTTPRAFVVPYAPVTAAMLRAHSNPNPYPIQYRRDDFSRYSQVRTPDLPLVGGDLYVSALKTCYDDGRIEFGLLLSHPVAGYQYRLGLMTNSELQFLLDATPLSLRAASAPYRMDGEYALFPVAAGQLQQMVQSSVVRLRISGIEDSRESRFTSPFTERLASFVARYITLPQSGAPCAPEPSGAQ